VAIILPSGPHQKDAKREADIVICQLSTKRRAALLNEHLTPEIGLGSVFSSLVIKFESRNRAHKPSWTATLVGLLYDRQRPLQAMRVPSRSGVEKALARAIYGLGLPFEAHRQVGTLD